MSRVPAVCGNCSLVFDSPVGFDSAVGSVVGMKTACPQCGASAKILDGIYIAAGDTLRILLTSNRSVQELESLRHVLKTAREQKASHEEITEAIKANAPELKRVADILPKTRVELYMFVGVIVAVITMLIAAYAAFQKTGPTETELQTMVEKAVTQICQPSQQSASVTQPRNRAERRARGRPVRHK